MSNTLVFEGFIKEVKSRNLTAKEIRNIKKAIVDIGTHSLKWLKFADRIVPFDFNGIEMYMYRLNHKERIIFGVENGNKKIYDIVSIDDIKN